MLVTYVSIPFAWAVEGDATAGKAKSAMCSACHGANGLNPSPTYPNLAGQHAQYLVKQLKAFKDGSRGDAVMAPMAAGLSEQDMADIAAFYSSQPMTEATDTSGSDAMTPSSAAVASAPVFEPDPAIGKSIYEIGDETRGLASCIGCHGKDGNSDVLIYPNLAEQHSDYVEKQLNHFKNDERVNAAMNQFAKALSDEEIKHLAVYLENPAAVTNVKARKLAAPMAMNSSAVDGKAKSVTCAACHGADGNAAVPIYPKLAGQSATYIVSQLKAFKDGSRADTVMAGMAAALSEQDMIDLGNFYASQQSTPGNGTANELGQKLFLDGDVERGITSCAACHGNDGRGMALAGFPVLAQQNADYLKAQLEKFRSGARNNDKNSMMSGIAIKLEDEDIQALAQFMSSLN